MSRSILSVSIEPEMKRRLEKLAKSRNQSKSDLVKDALRRYLAVQEFRKLREQILPYGRKSWLLSDEDVFRNMS